MLTREQILASSDRKRELVEVPEWGGSVYVATMSGSDRDEWEASLIGPDGKGRVPPDVRARLVALTVVNENWERLFTAADVIALSAKDSVPMDRIINVTRRLSKIGEQELEAAEKN